jgi:hypothetical protein
LININFFIFVNFALVFSVWIIALALYIIPLKLNNYKEQRILLIFGVF